jgi:TetR/AcrR family transcriptional repressor of bet genes
MSLAERHLSPTSQRMQARIIDAVIATVSECGISGTTLAQVAKRAGVSQGVLVFHFGSKEALLAETLHRQNEAYRHLWQEAAQRGDPLDRVLGLIRVDYCAAICSQPTLALWFGFWGETTARPIYRALCTEAERLREAAMLDAMRDLVAAHGGPDPALLANAVDSMTDGLWLQMHLQRGGLTRTMALDRALDHLRHLLPHLAARI